MQYRRVAAPFAALVLTAVLSACGGGGSVSPVSGPATAPLPSGIALLTPANGAISASVAASAADDLVLAQAATTPTQPSGGGALAQFAATVTDTAGTSGTSTARAAASLDAQRSAR
ncbi:MAG: hypothetical protein JWO66_105, partial [Candidatus Eremiobacteraeota bacterium]|nr:hypothetical protein [Candidatus Eremiobacteraeota bacterium]